MSRLNVQKGSAPALKHQAVSFPDNRQHLNLLGLLQALMAECMLYAFYTSLLNMMLLLILCHHCDFDFNVENYRHGFLH